VSLFKKAEEIWAELLQGFHDLPGQFAGEPVVRGEHLHLMGTEQRANLKLRHPPIPTPRTLASLERATTHPSLLDSTTMGFPSSIGLKTRSQEA